MAQSSGYPNSVPPIPGSNNSGGPNFILNGQPPQWGKPPMTTMKPSRQPNYQSYMNQSNPVSSNGTPSQPSLSNPGSLSSHSSRDPSPIPSNCSDSMARSQDNALNPYPPSLQHHSPHQRFNPSVSSSSMPQMSNNQQILQQSYPQMKPKINQSVGENMSGPIPLLPKQYKDGHEMTGINSQGQKLSTGSTISSAQFSHSGTISPSRSLQGNQKAFGPTISQNQSQPVTRSNQIITSSSTSQNMTQNQRHTNTSVANASNVSSSSFQMYSQPLVTSQLTTNGPHGGVTNCDVPGARQTNTVTASRTDSSFTGTQQRLGQDGKVQSGQEAYGHQNNISNQYSQHPATSAGVTSGSLSSTVGSSVQGHAQTSVYPYASGSNQNSQSQILPPTSLNKLGQGSNPYIFQGSANNSAGQYPGMPSSQVKTPTSVPASFGPTKPHSLVTANASQIPPPPTNVSGQYPPVSGQNPRYPNPPNSSAPGQYISSPPSNQVPGQQPPPGPPLPGLPSGPPPSQGQQFQQVSNQAPQYPLGGVSSGYSSHGLPPTQTAYQSSVPQDGQQLSKRYPQPIYPTSQPADGLVAPMGNLSVTRQGFNKLWGLEYYDLLQTRNILPPDRVEAPKVKLHQEFLDNVNCSPDIFRCTLTKIPESNSLLQKSRLPLGILIHPFKDLNHLPVIQCSTIVRCRVCRTYIHPFVYFVDHKHWKCNLCFRVNELPEEFQYDPVSKTYGDPTRRPEVKSSTIEFIAPSEYMLRPPQPAVYLFVLDVSQLAVESGYLQIFCDVLLDELDRLPGDGRTQIGFITFDSNVHFYNLAEGLSQPQQMIVLDTDDVFLPCPDNLLVNLAESRELVRDLLQQLPQKFQSSYDNHSALGAALQAAYKLMAPTGGRISVFQSSLPTTGPGSLVAREDPNQRSGKDAPHLNPATDFYKLLALDCSGQQVAVDLFLLNSQYCDLATTSGVSRFSGGCIYHFPLFKASNVLQAESFERVLRRYFSRKIGFEAVMRIRCSRGLAIHTFHGNFFVRSTDLLSLPNVNPDAGFGMQVSIEESLSEVQNVCFQAALLYTTSKGERRIRVHTLCLPVATTLPDILNAADQQCIVGLLAKMAVDRSHQSSLSDARDAFINVAIDVLSAYRVVQPSGPSGALLAPHNLRLLPLYILALLKYVAFRTGQSTRLDDRLYAMCQMKTLPLAFLIQTIYPDLYPVHCLEEQLTTLEDGTLIPQPPRLHLTAEKLDHRGAFLLDTGDHMLMYVGRSVSPEFCTDVLGVAGFNSIPEEMYELPVLESVKSENIRNFINRLQAERPHCATLEIIRDDSPRRVKFTERLIEDRTESALSYYEFLQHLKANVK
ncbi:Protein transport protein Sec24B [Gryllus bimaculatus]|nr:Protein transport protein Sec24B [Gryllus bimaculatus]